MSNSNTAEVKAPESRGTTNRSIIIIGALIFDLTQKREAPLKES